MNRKNLLNMLEALLPITGQTALMDEATCFRFSDNEIRVMDGKTMAIATLAEPHGLDCLIPAKKLVSWIKSVNDDDIRLTQSEDGNHVEAVGSRSKVKYGVTREGQHLDNLDFDVEDWKPVAKGMIDAVAAVRFAASSDASRGPLRGIKVGSDHCVASDGPRIVAGYWRAEDGSGVGQDLILSADAADILAKHSDEVDAWAIKGSVVYFRLTTGIVIGSAIVTGDYPPAEAFLDKATELDMELSFPTAILTSISRSISQQDDVPDQDREVRIRAEGKELIVETFATAMLEDHIDLDREVSRKFAFRIHPSLLAGILSRDSVMRYGDKDYVSFGGQSIPEGKDFTTMYLASVERM